MFSVRTFKEKRLALRGSKGFTLIELMIVITVIAILATIALFGLRGTQASARNTQRQQIMNSVRASLERYNGDKSSYPAIGDFSNLMTSLSGAGYYSPYPQDPGCGTGGVLFPGGSEGGNTWYPCGAGVTIPAYSYVQAGTAYTLTLFKEGGGSSVFVSPQ